MSTPDQQQSRPSSNLEKDSSSVFPLCANCGKRGRPLGVCHKDLEDACSECGIMGGNLVEHKPGWCWNSDIPTFREGAESGE